MGTCRRCGWETSAVACAKTVWALVWALSVECRACRQELEASPGVASHAVHLRQLLGVVGTSKDRVATRGPWRATPCEIWNVTQHAKVLQLPVYDMAATTAVALAAAHGGAGQLGAGLMCFAGGEGLVRGAWGEKHGTVRHAGASWGWDTVSPGAAALVTMRGSCSTLTGARQVEEHGLKYHIGRHYCLIQVNKARTVITESQHCGCTSSELRKQTAGGPGEAV